jgi:FAD/FMN-containing dehydrogenase
MNRRALLKLLTAIPVVQVVCPPLSTPARTAARFPISPGPRVRPSDPDWPSSENWEMLKQQVGGRLIRVESPLAACQSAPGSAACQAVLKDLQNPYFIGDEPGATQTTGWLDGWTSTPSAYAVAARNTADVVAAVNFARVNNLRLVVKGGGHSYQGTSNAADSLLIWTRTMKNIVLHDAFVPAGCSGKLAPHPAVTIDAGAMWMDAYNAVTTIGGRYVQGGGCTTVGVAGLIQSGGFGSFSKSYGMAAAGLMEAEVVTADGVVRTANAYTHPDLFWAIKGGGGGTFGVVTKVTLRTRELPAFFGRVQATIKACSDDAFRRLIGRFVAFYSERLFNSQWGESITFRSDNTFLITMSYQGSDQQEPRKVWQPFFDWVARTPQEFNIVSTPYLGTMPARNYWDAAYREKNHPGAVLTDPRPGSPATQVWWASTQEEVGIYVHGYESMWLPSSLLQNDQRSRLVDALFASTRYWEVFLHFNKGLAGAPAEAIAAAADTAINPTVLNAFTLVIIAGGKPLAYPGIPGHEPDLTVARRDARAISRSMDELRKIVANPGSYVSEGNFYEQSWQRAYWGTNYPRLRIVKTKYDPEGLFFVHHGVGSEGWSADGFRPVAGG